MNIDIKNTKPYNEIIEYTDIIKCVEEREEKNNINKEHSIFDYDNEDYLNNFFLLQQDYMDNYRRKDLDRNLDSLRYVNLIDIEKEYRQEQSKLLESVTSDYELSIQARLDAAKNTEERLFSLIETKEDAPKEVEAESWTGENSLPLFAIILIIIFVSVLVGAIILKLGKKKVVYLKPKDPTPAAPSVYTTPPTTTSENQDVVQSEVRSLRQSAVTMSAGQKEGASQIISDWLDEGTSDDDNDNNAEKEE